MNDYEPHYAGSDLNSLFRSYMRLFKHMTHRTIPLRPLEDRDFGRQLARFFDLAQLYGRRSSRLAPAIKHLGTTPAAHTAFERALELIWTIWAPYNDSLQAQCREAIKVT